MSQNRRIVGHQRHITKTLIRDYGEGVVLKRLPESNESPSGQIRRVSKDRTARPEQALAFMGVSQDLVRRIPADGGIQLELKWNLVGMPGADIEQGDTFDLYGTTYFVHEVVPDQRWEVRAWVREYGRDAVQG